MSEQGWVKRVAEDGESAPIQLLRTDMVEYQLRGDPTVRRDEAGNLFWAPEGGIVAWRKVAVVPVRPTGVGDVNGTALGSGARFNAGKPDLSLIPAGILGRYAATMPSERPSEIDWPVVLMRLGRFQMTRDQQYLGALLDALHLMDNDGQMWADCARVFSYGQKKYAQRGDCTCPAGNAARLSMSRVETACAAATTKKTSALETQSSLLGSAKTVATGTPETPPWSRKSSSADTPNADLTPSTKSASAIGESKSSTDLNGPNTTGWLASVVQSALPKIDCMSTTITQLGEYGECFAIPATSALDFSNGLTAGLALHAPTCGVQRIAGKGGEWNWARGQAWSIPIASALRHIVFGTLVGETLDPESGLSHRGHIACNIVMLLWFIDHYPEGDDRFTPPALPHA